MKDAKHIFFIAVAIMIAIVVILGIIFGNIKHKDNIEKPVESEMIDSIVNDLVIDYNWKLDSLYSDIIILTDSIELLQNENNRLLNIIDSINEELFIDEYKLERIKEYNRIAAQGNNITFLRGWINRVLNE